MAFPRTSVSKVVASLAQAGVYLGTSSWKYEGWIGLLYTKERYMTRGRFSATKFEDTCLAEYAEVFKSVCFDGGYYQFPSAKMLDGFFSQVPADFRLSIKVTEEITVRQYPHISRYGKRAGQPNENFLNASTFISSFLAPLEVYRERMGTLIFEFGQFYGESLRWEEFIELLDQFLGAIPKGWNYAVEVRTESVLCPEYFSLLRRHGVSHTFNSWSKMPPVKRQMELPDSFTAPFAAGRFLLNPGRGYEQAVQTFSPYSEVKEVNQDARSALAELLTPAKSGRRYIYVNNRLEGCALWTIAEVLKAIVGTEWKEDVAPEVSDILPF